MQLPIAIHKDDGSTYGVIVPDIPGCHSWGDSIDEAIKNAKEAIYGHVETLILLGENIDLHASTIETLKESEEFSDATWAFVDVNPAELDPKPERVNISIPRYILRRIDSFVEQHHDSRSGFLTRAALNEIEHSL